jgi:A/G-specific adenine glycosylase
MKREPKRDAAPIREFREQLLNWYKRHRRMLPWRVDPNPYRVWISEIMLQQTQVKTVIPYYSRFLARFPDLQSLAQASEEEVLSLWSGLGYYSRARNLLKAARQIARSGGVFPSGIDEILSLPGIGRYTAGAICSIAYNRPQPAVDGNIRRVIARLNGLRGRAPESYFYHQMAAWMPQRQAASFTQSMMELGAVICLPSTPDCIRCAVADFCEAHRLGIQDTIPRIRAKRPVKRIRIAALVLERKGKILLTSSGRIRYIPGKWGLPVRTLAKGEKPEEVAAFMCRKMLGETVRLEAYTPVRHSIADRRIVCYGFGGETGSTALHFPASGAFHWIDPSSSGSALISSIYHKILKNAGIGSAD